MNICELKFTPPKMIATAINMGISVAIAISINAIIKSPPLIAQEIKLAQSGVVTPILEASRINKDINKLSKSEQIEKFNNEIKRKYRSGYIYDVADGVKHIKLTKYYNNRPVRINVVEINKNINPDLEITPQLASGKLSSKSTITTIAKKNNSIVAINGTYFKPQTGVPLGTLMINKKLYTGPIYNRVAMGIFDNGFDMARIELNAEITSSKGTIKIDNINQPRMLSTYVLVYTPEWGALAPPSPKYGKQIAISDGKIINISTQALPIPENGYVIVGPSEILTKIEKSKKVELNIKTNPDWDKVKHIISGGPYLVKNGNIFIDMTEQKLGAIGGRNPRTAIGYTEEGNLILVTVDGREGASVGMTLNELAHFMQSAGCINAMNLDGGGSTVMYVRGHVVNMPQVKGGIALSNALTIDLKS